MSVTCKRHIWGVTFFFLRMKRNQEQVFKREGKFLFIIGMSGWKTKIDRSIYLKTKQTARSTEVAVKLLISPQMFSGDFS